MQHKCVVFGCIGTSRLVAELQDRPLRDFSRQYLFGRSHVNTSLAAPAVQGLCSPNAAAMLRGLVRTTTRSLRRHLQCA